MTIAALLIPQAVVLGLAAALRVWRLDQNGFDNEYYAAAVRSMAGSWHNFFYNAADPGGFVSVDKPPVALWVQVAAVKVFGFGWPSVLLPQVLEGVASVWLVWHLVHRRFGTTAGFLAALFLAVTPISVAIDRSGNTDTCLVLVLLLAAWALTRAAEEGSRRHLLLAMALLGLGFNVKMLAAVVVLPAFALVYWLGARTGWRRAIGDLALGGAVLAVVAASWVVAYDLTPPGARPFAGSSRHNSMVELAVGHNGVGRFVRLWSDPRAPAAGADASPAPTSRAAAASAQLPSWWSRFFVRVPVGPLRLADGHLGGQVGWLFPLALAGVGAVALAGRWRRPLSPSRLAVVMWLGWLVTYVGVYSAAGGIFHFYYMSTLAPPLAALAGIGVARLWRSHVDGRWPALALPAALVVTAAWQIHLESSALDVGARGVLMSALDGARGVGGWMGWLHLDLIAGTVLAAALLLGLRKHPREFVLSAGALAVGLAALLVTPVAWSLSSVLAKGVAVMPSADLARLAPGQAAAETASRFGPATVRRLTGFLAANRHDERFLLAATSARLASPIIIETGEPVMAIGGFHGLDQILTPDRLAQMVAASEIRFAMLGDLSLVSRRMGGEAASRPIADWVRAHGQPVDPALWRLGGRGSAGRGSPMQLYDLRPEAGPIAPAPD